MENTNDASESNLTEGLSFHKKLGLNAKIALPYCIILSTFSFSLWLLFTQLHRNNLELQGYNLGTIIAEQSAESVTELVLTNDLLSLNVFLTQLVKAEGVHYAAVYNVDEQLIAASGSNLLEENDNTLFFSSAINLQDSTAGRIEITLSSSTTIQQDQLPAVLFWALLALALIMCVLMAHSLAKHIRRPLLKLSQQLANPNESEPETPSEREDEIGALFNSGQSLLNEYQQTKSELHAHNQQISNLIENSRKQHSTSILYIEVINYGTTLALLNPTTLSQLLNSYFQLLNQAGKLYNGICYQFSGHSIMVGFPGENTEATVQRAVNCLSLFKHIVAIVNKQYKQTASPALDFRAIINSGNVVPVHACQHSKAMQTIIGTCITEIQQCIDACGESLINMTEASYNAAQASLKEVQHDKTVTESKAGLVYSLPATFSFQADAIVEQAQQILTINQNHKLDT